MTFRTACALGVLMLAAVSGNVFADTVTPRFANVFSDHAVVQRGQAINLWGRAAPSAALTVSLNGQSVNAKADAAGKWRVALPAMTAGGPYTLTVADGAATTTLNDIMVGDVVMCGGQSNMQFPARLSTGAWSGIGASANNNLRFILVQNESEPLPLDELKTAATWKVVGPDTVGEASAVCHEMAMVLQKDQGVAIGMIDSYWGGTTIQGWISDPTLRTLPAYAPGLDAVKLLGRDHAGAMAGQSKLEETWWDAHDPANKANRAFAAPGFDDSKWPSLNATGSWKDAGPAELKDFDGVVWLRTSVTLTADQAAKANELLLGPADTYDTTWVNGTYVGSSGMSWLWRDYTVAPGVFKAGTNSIVMRILGSGGLTGQAANRFIKMSDGQAVPVPSVWKYKAGMRAKGLSLPAAPWAIPTSLSTLYNGMIAPFAGYHVKLAAWYQGEANTGAAAEYRTLLPMLMGDWRKSFDTPNLPFVVAQLSSFGPVSTQPGKSDWADLRESQRLAVDGDPHAGLAVTIDVGDRTDIHPTQKVVVGGRLARAARSVAYGEAVSRGGPEATSVARSGTDLVISFRDTNGGLRAYSSDTAIGFEACAGEVCHYVAGTLSGDTIVLKGAGTADVTRVRYAWSDAPYVNLYSADDLPAVPFQLNLP